ncbi:hypothetical protein M1M27_gp17 [Cellulophaga phage Ingeline_1]|uniref:Uncharacterized protein n=1 Tax=Cellulophaga phage Ingeline_1 TaxID=2745674 RepID=A0A8E4ZBL9_9CAUD|nr:hypothetical protein M1M27_gp17 [Cellulophaga phage Ingeline_1]QQV90022.1 hypothetical protein Ingeline2_34 [Cellulophaga phage Ingeline_2]QQV90072.1 hypothetical protein Ingeline3_34 [Cellulophaga phage Ingeline_3]QQV90122.1 hypothetical protein Ingeline4_34 [Cellulophaga phage Ingeline_4]QQV90171.1 hypothetical protein Ingeline5_33 [Cellulophaga phage Ingeline_5]QQV90221.1 hypothetical protein Ingeline6_34 [Cellulophaga phage Ingeline_6]QQV90271.1 hypothetical protein Ingeline7_34 [Cellu
MITKREASKYKKEIGSGYIAKVLSFFKTKHYTRLSGKEYSQQDIINIMGGRENITLEMRVIEVVAHYKLLKIQREAKKEALLNPKTIKNESSKTQSILSTNCDQFCVGSCQSNCSVIEQKKP